MTLFSLKRLSITDTFLFIPGILWGISFVSNKALLGYLSPALIAFSGSLITTLFYLVFLLRLGQALDTRWQNWVGYLASAFFNQSLPFLLNGWGQQFIDSGLATILISTNPLFVLLFAHFVIESERMNWRKLFGISIGFLGVVVLVFPTIQAGEFGSLWGQAAILGSAISYAVGAVVLQLILIRQNAQKMPPQTDQTAEGDGWKAVLAITFSQYLLSTIMLAGFAFAFDRPADLWGIPPVAWGLVLFQAIIISAVANLVYFITIDLKGAGAATATVYLIPISGVLGGAILLGETITGWVIVSLILTLNGIAWVNRGD